MGIYRRGGKWWVDYFDRSRQRIQESSHSSIRRDAEQLLALRKSEVLRGVYRRPVKITLAQFSERYMEHAKANKRFNLATAWDLFLEHNPVCRVKFFREFNIHRRILGLEEEDRLRTSAAPFLQDLIVFALNTGLRVGEIFSLQWSYVDLEKGILNVFAPKTGKTRPVPINSEARRVLEAWGAWQKE